jgi:hypothetical protein
MASVPVRCIGQPLLFGVLALLTPHAGEGAGAVRADGRHVFEIGRQNRNAGLHTPKS